MDREKLEKAAAFYAQEANVSRENFELSDLEDAVIVGVEFMEAQPLEERVTPEEILKIKEQALGSQWHDPRNVLPVFGREIMIYYRSMHRGKWVENYAIDDRSVWYDPFTDKKREVIAWMYVPEIPKTIKR